MVEQGGIVMWQHFCCGAHQEKCLKALEGTQQWATKWPCDDAMFHEYDVMTYIFTRDFKLILMCDDIHFPYKINTVSPETWQTVFAYMIMKVKVK